jgi:hypothetical protein
LYLGFKELFLEKIAKILFRNLLKEYPVLME